VDKSTPAVFLIHGLGGTQYDLGSMHKRLKNAGFVTHSLTLPGHGTTPEDLVNVTAEQWMEAVTAKYHEVAAQHDNFHIMGMCMGALLATTTGVNKWALMALPNSRPSTTAGTKATSTFSTNCCACFSVGSATTVARIFCQ